MPDLCKMSASGLQLQPFLLGLAMARVIPKLSLGRNRGLIAIFCAAFQRCWTLGRPYPLTRLHELGGSTAAIVHLAADPLDELLFFVVHRGALSYWTLSRSQVSRRSNISKLPTQPPVGGPAGR